MRSGWWTKNQLSTDPTLVSFSTFLRTYNNSTTSSRRGSNCSLNRFMRNAQLYYVRSHLCQRLPVHSCRHMRQQQNTAAATATATQVRLHSACCSEPWTLPRWRVPLMLWMLAEGRRQDLVDELERVGAKAAAQYLVARSQMNVPSAWLESALNTSTGRRHRLAGGRAEELDEDPSGCRGVSSTSMLRSSECAVLFFRRSGWVSWHAYGGLVLHPSRRVAGNRGFLWFRTCLCFHQSNNVAR